MTTTRTSTYTNRRVSIRGVRPQVEGGRFPAKASVGEPVTVAADVFADSHDLVAAVLRWRRQGQRAWTEVPMELVVNDRWTASVDVDEPGRYEFAITGWIDHVATWQRDLRAKLAAGVVDAVDLAIGAALLADLADLANPTVGGTGEAKPADAKRSGDAGALGHARDALTDPTVGVTARAEAALTDEVTALARRHDPRRHATESERFAVHVDRERARYSTWYEMFPRSAAPPPAPGEPSRHGTFDDVIARLPYVRSMGFDVLYLPPIHPIGVAHRKGPNNRVGADPGDPGSPWAIGGTEGGHTAIHPELGTADDFRRLIAAAADHGLEVAMDIAFQCSPDHPWVAEHPEWFTRRPDGTIQYAENPPKKYQDIYPLDFETADAEGLWRALRGVFQHWIDEGVRIFRVDNPHTKAFAFWQWCIDDITRAHPDVIVLAEAFTRPKVMKELARLGFTQSYTYFAWRDLKWEIEQYYTELFLTDVVDYFRPNSWPNTPDILTEFLQHGGRAAFVQKLVLAATLTANYGTYGPPFELMLHEARPGAEEYLDNEKYQIHHWQLDDGLAVDGGPSLAELIARVNRIRRENPALQQDRSFALHHVDNDQLIAYSKRAGDNVVLTVVNLDPHAFQAGRTWLDLDELGLGEHERFEVHDRLGDGRFVWQGADNYVALDPDVAPAHIFVIRPLDRDGAGTDAGDGHDGADGDDGDDGGDST